MKNISVTPKMHQIQVLPPPPDLAREAYSASQTPSKWGGACCPLLRTPPHRRWYFAPGASPVCALNRHKLIN